MSTIEKMSIQGIRSFSPEDKQLIQFYAPLTLILGPNGTGKTTIIECLKYMTTGVMPPGCTKGGAFIHDPKIAHEREVKAQVRLQFKDIARKQCVVQRSIIAIQKAKKVESKTLDGVITRVNAAGEKQSVNSKCADLDREMISALGVSKPVLENVIFCHQEDANWPLNEGKQVKEKFDAIFASTRYVKALEVIKKVKKEQDDKLKLYKQDIQYLKLHKDKASQYASDLGEQETKLAASKESVQRIKDKLKPIEDKMDKIDRKSAEIFEIQNNLTKLTSEKKQLGKHAAELREQIENEFQGSDEELKRMIAEFQDKLDERQKTLKEYEDRNTELREKIEDIGGEKSVILKELGALEQEAERHIDNLRKRENLVVKYAEEYSFEDLKEPITDEKYKRFLGCLRDKLENMVTATKQLKTDHEKRENEVQSRIDKERDAKTKLEQSEEMKRKMMMDNETKIRQINQKLSEIEASGGRLDQIRRELRRSEHELKTVEESMNTKLVKEEIEELTRDKSRLEARISELSSEMNRLTLQSSAQAEVDVLKKDKVAKEENIRRLKAKHEDTIKYLLGHMPSRNIRGDLEEYISKQSQDVRKCSQEKHDVQNSISKKETERKMLMDQLKKKEEDFKNLEEKVYNVCGSQNYDEGLGIIQEKMDKSRDQRGSLLGAQHLFKKYTGDLEKEGPSCPLCHRDFDTGQEVRELILELKNKLRMVPDKLKQAEREIDEYQEKYDSLMQLKPLRENMELLEETEIPKLKSTLKTRQEELQKLKSKLESLDEALQVQENDEAMAKMAQPDIVMMDQYYGQISELDKKISIQSSKLTGGDSGRTLQMVIDEKEELQMEVDSKAKQIDRKRLKLSEYADQVQKLRDETNQLREEKLKIENDLQQRIKLEEDKTNLQTENTTFQEEIKDAKDQIKPLQVKIESLKKEKDSIIQQKEEVVEEAKADIEAVKNNGNKVKNLNLEIKSYNQSSKAEDLQQKKERKSKIDKKMEKYDTELKDVSVNIDKIRHDLSKQKVRELDLQNNLVLRNKMKEERTLTDKIAELDDKLEGLDVKHLDRERRRLQHEFESLNSEKQTAAGRQTGFEDMIRNIKKELQSDMYKDADVKHRNKMIDLRTTELANNDLEKYYKAMDKAIMTFHSMKMAEINKIIRELWRNTYRGNDIETIEIRSDEDEAATINKRKTYNYRVVMIKPGDAVIDMRGRCSAGQKVLASLIIRLALAETFCLNCGILALDEPTTNLDRENIESLAAALVEIIKGRIHQRNFQLVVITHDEDFVELMGRSEYVEWFYKVSKNTYGCSQLTKAKVQDLHAR